MDVTRRDGLPRLPASVAELARTAARGLHAASAPAPASVALILSDDRELAQLNREHIGEDGPTDVLSFPMLQPDAFPRHAGQRADAATRRSRELSYQPPRGRRTHLGDIVISVERAIEQAHLGRGGQTGDIAWSAADELRLLVVHGVLHICGWDHADAAERDAMRKLEREVLSES